MVGSLALAGGKLSPTTRDSIASLLAINYERVRALNRAAAAEVAKRNEEFKSSLLDGLAHDLKTPLTAIRTCVTRLITIPPRSEEVRQELLAIIDQASERLQQSITEAIELARIESQELHLHREAAGLADLARTAVSETRDENPARYSIEIPPDLVLEVDSGLIRRALMQLLENAHKYSPPDSPIEIEARIEHDQAIISVMDRGPGIGPDELDRVFEKFYRGRKNTARTEGTGMGLAIAKGIIEAHGGGPCAESPGWGSGHRDYAAPANRDHIMNTATILVVDDEPQLRRAMKATLTDLGYSVMEAKTGEEALEVLRHDTADLILLDLNMPGIGGLETCRAIRETPTSDHRAFRAQHGARQSGGPRRGRRRLCNQAVRYPGVVGAHPRGHAARALRRRSRAACV